MSAFPVAEVERITGTRSPASAGTRGDSYVRFPDDGLTWERLNELVQVGAADPEGAQNESPTIGELLDELANLGDKVRFSGYIVYPPRKDCRVSVDGFDARGVTADERSELTARYSADECEECRRQDGSYDLRFWWD